MTDYMQMALDLARQAATMGEVPVGAVVVTSEGLVIARAHNRTEIDHDPTAHAEILAIRQAALLMSDVRLTDCDLYVTLEPCAMCAAAISHARLRRVIFGAYDPKGGAIDHGSRWFTQPTCLHHPEIIGGVMETSCSTILKDFFRTLRQQPQ